LHWVIFAFSLALAKAGSNMAASMAMIAMTTRSSIRVNADPFDFNEHMSSIKNVESIFLRSRQPFNRLAGGGFPQLT
jgi:hypothetical protein